MYAMIAALSFGAAIFFIFRAMDIRRGLKAIDPLVMVFDATDEDGETEEKPSRSRWLIWASEQCVELGRNTTLLPRPHNLEQQLAWAGKSREMTEDSFRGEQLLYMFFMLLLGGLFGLYYRGPLLGVTLGLVLGGGGIYFPLMQLKSDAKKRQQLVTVQLPDAIDLINTSVTAGLDVDRAITYTANNIHAPLNQEFQLFLSELQLGTPRLEAYRHLMWRNSSEEMQSTVGALLQGQSLGVPISETLQAQAEAMRERRMQRAKEAGAQASPRISLIMTLFVMPSVFIMFLTIMAYQIARDFGPTLSNLNAG